ncbi:MAG: hydrogenase maturation protease [Bacteroidales bacterium]|jgi:hydrogenase maturation protease|nr:hydrogenase maturation protease [Bacteroidales bacterium]MDY0315067.1 hydrogenase maturation protease [Bacteroidales bacterium]NLB87301.1 hydrogenase maturation protease [Bacteroidales bacterium]
MEDAKNILIYAYGNPGRQDDGLGNAFAENIETWITEKAIKGIEVESNYQLNIEDSDLISTKDIVLFVDATIEEIENFYIDEVKASDAKIEFTMHAVSPAFVLNLCNQIYDKDPKCYLLHIKGYEWGFKEELSEKAIENLNLALDFVKKEILLGLNFDKVESL